MKLTDAIELMLLRLGYRPQLRGICTGILYTAANAFLCGDMANYKKRLHLIGGKNDDVSIADIDAFAKKAKAIQRELKKHPSKTLTSEQEELLDYIGFLDVLMISQLPRRFTSLFGGYVSQEEVLPIFEMIASKRLEEKGGLVKLTTNEKNCRLSKASLSENLTILNEILLKSPFNVVIMLGGRIRDMGHRIGICFEAETKSWMIIDSDREIFSIPFTAVDQLYYAISLWSIDEADFAIYIAGRDTQKAEDVLEEYKKQVTNRHSQVKETKPESEQWRSLIKSTCIAAAMDRADEVEKYAEMGVDLNQYYSDKTRLTPASFAAKFGCTNAIKVLAKYRADFNLGEFGYTPTYIAADNQQADAIRELAVNGAKVDIKYQGETPLFVAAQNGDLACVRALVEANADVNIYCLNKTPIYIAAKWGYADVVEYLISQKADINKTNDNWRKDTPVYIAVNYGYVEVFETLAKHGANLIHKVGHDESPVTKAIERAEIDILKIMHLYGVDFSQPLPNGKAPLEMAKKYEHDHVIEYLESILSPANLTRMAY